MDKESETLVSTKAELMNQLHTLLGGHVAEKLYIGASKISTGCSNDLQRATELAYELVRNYGMEDEKYGLVNLPKDQLSEEQNKKVDEVVKLVLDVLIPLYNLIGCIRKGDEFVKKS